MIFWVIKVRRYLGVSISIGVLLFITVQFSFSFTAFAADSQPRDFSLIVSPSPLVTTAKPGVQTELELKIRNSGTAQEKLKIETCRFAIDETTGKVTLEKDKPSEVSQWVSFSKPTFTVDSGAWATEKVRIAVPKQAGFSYSFALIISRANDQTTIESGRVIKGSVAVFTLINVDRPGAVRKLEATDFTSDHVIYEYLPAQFKTTFKNTGNTIVQPSGNVFIQRGSNDKTPLTAMPVNDAGGYILPGSKRLLTSNWQDGFPVYHTNTEQDGSTKQDLVWDWSKLSNFRIGLYTAKLVAIYDDGHRDVPLEKEVTFWVVPWRILLGVLAIMVVLGVGLLSFIRKIIRLVKRTKKTSTQADESIK